jgi:DNA polymerase-3 subunit gamma/tau
VRDGFLVSQLAMYRKYRSADLTDLVGQSHVTTTLASAVKQGKLSHAYLFTGPRGVGKTSVARILARNINGLAADEDIVTYLDIIEIDAASNRGIDEIRALREKVAVAPAKLAYKVYIIDEAHMLTREAFNALLKTLEEPPAHVVFILATTEAHKLPETIISRTQRYDFHALTTEEIVKHLQFIAKAEKIDITDGALTLIAQIARGGMRDAISLLDQLAVLDGTIDEQVTSQFLGLASEAEVTELLKTCNNKQPANALALTRKILSSGVSPSELVGQLQQVARAQLIAAIDTNNAQAAFYIRALDVLHTASTQLSYTAQASIPLEVAIAKLSIAPQAEVAPEPDQQPKAAAEATKQSESKPIAQEVTAASDDAVALCDKALSNIKEHNNSLYALLRSGNAKVEGNTLSVNCRFAFHKNRIEEHNNRALIEKNMSKVFGRPIQLQCKLESAPVVTVAEKPDTDSELVNSAMAILGGELVE